MTLAQIIAAAAARFDARPLQRASTEAQRELRFDIKRFEQAPCHLCGYNGSDYYQSKVHPCAERYHAAVVARLRGLR